MKSTLSMPATELAAQTRSGAVSARAAVEMSIERIRGLNPSLNALVADRFENALAAADDLDALRASGAELGPLHGVPFVVPESVAVRGLPHSAGLLSRGGILADFDATVVDRLRDAGAIALGVSNVAEFAFWVETHSRLYGRANNPWNVERTTGGANGGDAALVAAGCVPFAVSFDTNGSTRIPAAHCGVFGYRSSGHETPLTGLYPLPVGKARRYAGAGIMARSAADLPVIAHVLRGRDGVDRGVVPGLPDLADPAGVRFDLRRLIVCADLGVPGLAPRPDVRRALGRAAEALQAEGAEIERWRPDALARTPGIWLALQHEAYGLHHTFAEALGEGRSISLALESVRMAAGRSRHTWPAVAMVALERATKGSYARIQRFCAEGRRLRDRLNAMLADGGVMLLPTYPRVAPAHRATGLRPLDFLYAGLVSVMGLPACSVPAGLSRDGLPIGVQVVAAQGHDEVVFAAAAALERRLGGWVEPAPLRSRAEVRRGRARRAAAAR
jgi:fatty acid amide hydrolase 2